jgi:hypothetical protein
MTNPKPTELQLGASKAFDGSAAEALIFINSVQMYLLVNETVYDSDAKQITYALSHMTEGSALTWASTFRAKALSSFPPSFGTIFKSFGTAFVHLDTKADAIAWLSSTRMAKDSALTTYISDFQNRVALSGIMSDNILIGYFSSGLSVSLMHYIYCMDTPSTKILEWYAKAIHFKNQWERVDGVANHNKKTPSYIPYLHGLSTRTEKDPNAMDIDAIHIPNLPPGEKAMH